MKRKFLDFFLKAKKDGQIKKQSKSGLESRKCCEKMHFLFLFYEISQNNIGKRQKKIGL